MKAHTLFLASSSPRRRELLRRLGLKFRVIRPQVPESGRFRTPARFARALARAKALAVAPRVKSGIIIGVDTIVVLGSRIMGKPADRIEARRMLQALSGRTHRVISGVCLHQRPQGRTLSTTVTSRVSFRQLEPAEIQAYLATSEPYDKAGAYAIQGRAAFFVSRIEGDYLNIVGLPVARLLEMLRQLAARR